MANMCHPLTALSNYKSETECKHSALLVDKGLVTYSTFFALHNVCGCIRKKNVHISEIRASRVILYH